MSGVTIAVLRHDFVTGSQRTEAAVRRAAVYADARMSPAAVAAFVLLAGIGVAIAAVSFLVKREDDLDEMLRPYRLVASGGGGDDRERGLRPLFRRTGDWLVGRVEARGLRPALERRLTRSGLSITSGEFLVISVLALVVAAAVGFLAGHAAGLCLGLFVGGLAPWGFLQVKIDRRQRAFGAQLPDLLKLLASSLRAGFSLMQCLMAVTARSTDPMRTELQNAMARIGLGEPVEEALAGVADRVGSRDLRWTVMAIGIQREVGGNLAEILDTVAETMIERERIRREVRTLTAEGAAGAIILAALPFALGAFIFLVNRAYMNVMLSSVSGQIALMVGVLMELVGGWWMYRTIQVEV